MFATIKYSFNCILTFLLGAAIVLISAKNLLNVSDNIADLNGFWDISKLNMLKDFTREIYYVLVLSGIYSGFLCMFRQQTTKLFALLFFVFKFLMFYNGFHKNKFAYDGVNLTVLSLEISLLGGILSI